MANWIWKFGDFEIYHNQQIHRRRQAYGHTEPAVWKIYRPEPVVEFTKEIETEGGPIHVEACGDFSVSLMDVPNIRDPQWFGEKDVMLPAGRHILDVRVMNFETFPAVYVDGIVESDASWYADDMTWHPEKAATDDAFSDREKRPDVFPFAYEPISYVKKEALLGGGVLFDFGKETFARTLISGLVPGQMFRVQFGESREEALDPVWSVIHFDAAADENGQKCFASYAFRYIYLSRAEADIRAEYEYLPMRKKGSFRSDDSRLDQIWDVSDYTFHLNCREMFLDGIKRDRWVWSADTYQSLFVNRYLFGDKKIEQRTLIALGGKRPFIRHINTIVDYTFFWFMSLEEHYRTYGDLEFLQRMKPQMDEILAFCLARTDADGFVRGRKEDWIFIDWADMDKTGAVAGEQILYAKALAAYAAICGAIGADDRGCAARAEELQQKIVEKFWDPARHAFIDSFESGKRKITRQTNIFAYLFLPCTKEQKEDIYRNVILNPAVAPITTPYFEFYENQVYGLAGNLEYLKKSIKDYYGGMLANGATTLYEEYDPQEKGAEHYAMYGRPFEKSLCHAWSASPIYLLGRFVLGVNNTGIAYSTYEVRPCVGLLREAEGSVPVPGGYIRVRISGNEVTVRSDIPGGTLVLGDRTYAIAAGEKITAR